MKVRLAATLALAASLSAQTPAFTDPQRRAKLAAAFPEIEKTFENFRSVRGLPGLVYGVVIDGELALVKGIGVRNRSGNPPVTPDTVFRIASMTKSFTSLAILKLRDEGKLSLEDPVAKWIPEFASMKYPTRDTAPIRVRQLLTHAAGFPEDNPWGDRQLAQPDEVMTGWLRKGLPFSTPPDTQYEYSNYGFALLGRIVAKASGKSYREYLENQILAPLGMSSSTLEPSAIPADRAATGYRRDGTTYEEEPSLAHGSFGAMGGLATTARDLAKYVAFHLAAYPPRDDADNGPVRRSSVREMQHAWNPSGMSAQRASLEVPVQASARAYGYGLSVSQDCRFGHVAGHGGGLPGFGSYMMWLPEYGVGIFAMDNLTYAGPTVAINTAFDLLRKTGGLRKRELAPSPALSSTRDAIFRLWRDWSDRGLNALAADNLLLDSPADRRRKEIEKLQSQVGACRSAGDVRPLNLLRGTFRLDCERGFVDATFTLAPTMPPKVQHLSFNAINKLDSAMQSFASAVAEQIANPSSQRLAAISGPTVDAAFLAKQIESLKPVYLSCKAGAPVSGDGVKSARVRLECDGGPVDINIKAEQGKLSEVRFAAAPGSTCSP